MEPIVAKVSRDAGSGNGEAVHIRLRQRSLRKSESWQTQVIDKQGIDLPGHPGDGAGHCLPRRLYHAERIDLVRSRDADFDDLGYLVDPGNKQLPPGRAELFRIAHSLQQLK